MLDKRCCERRYIRALQSWELTVAGAPFRPDDLVPIAAAEHGKPENLGVGMAELGQPEYHLVCRVDEVCRVANREA